MGVFGIRSGGDEAHTSKVRDVLGCNGCIGPPQRSKLKALAALFPQSWSSNKPNAMSDMTSPRVITT